MTDYDNVVSNGPSTVGFVDLEEFGEDAEAESTLVSIDIFEDWIDAAKALNTRHVDGAEVLLLEDPETWDNPALAITTESSGDVAVALAPRRHVGGDDA